MSTNITAFKSPSQRRHIPHSRIDHGSDIERRYTLGSKLGKGSFGSVIEASRLTDNTKWALKIINKEKAGSAHVKLLEHEVKIMKKVNHKNIIHLEEVFESMDKMYLVMEFCAHGGLDEVLKEKVFFPEREALDIFQQLADAVCYMHENEITHRDLKLDNILLASPSEEVLYFIKLADFGLSYTRGGSGSDYMMTQAVGTPMYMAPEVIINYGYSQQCDIWSIGIVLHMLLSGKAPFIANTEAELHELIKKGELNFSTKRWAGISPAAKQLIEGMLKVDPAHRLTSKEVLCQPWMKGEESVDGNTPMNVLEMMKLCRLEQEKNGRSSTDSLEDVEYIHEDICIESSDGNENECDVRNSDSTTENIEKPNRNIKPVIDIHCSSSTQATSSPIKKNSKTTVPNYMQPTKSSTSSKMCNTRQTKKK